MKTNTITLIIIISLTVSGCADFLEENLKSDVSASSYFVDRKGWEAAVNASYSYLKQFYGQENPMHLVVSGTDEWLRGADHRIPGIGLYDATLNGSVDRINQTWTIHYSAINQCNVVISRAETISDLTDPVLKNEKLAEVRFLRALYHFNLTQLFGNISLRLEETVGPDTNAKRTPIGQVYSEGIIPDLEFAIENLPDQHAEYGRATKPAAEFLLSKVLLTRGYTADAAPDDFAKAFELAKGVIEKYNFTLLSDWGKIWDHDNERHSEVIWSVQNSIDPLSNGDGNRSHLYFIAEYDIIPGMVRDLGNGRPFKRFRPSPYLLNTWDRSIDSRYDKGFKEVFYSNNAASIPKDENGKAKFNVGDTALWILGPGVTLTPEQISQKPYLVVSSNTNRLFPTLIKFLDEKRPDRQYEFGSRDWYVMRLADVYLIAAEALHMMGQNEEAASYVNFVRRRAAWPGKESDMEILSSDVTLDFILDERSRELAGEMHRRFDLVRMGKLVERVRLYNNEASSNILDFHTVLPIPQSQIDLTVNDDGEVFLQNPGYQ